MESAKKHSIKLDGDGSVTVCGVVAVESICDREAVLLCENKKLIIKGVSVHVSMLNVEQGVVSLECTEVHSMSYTGQKSEKFNFKNLFK